MFPDLGWEVTSRTIIALARNNDIPLLFVFSGHPKSLVKQQESFFLLLLESFFSLTKTFLNQSLDGKAINGGKSPPKDSKKSPHGGSGAEATCDP
jgi:hypothetical protein